MRDKIEAILNNLRWGEYNSDEYVNAQLRELFQQELLECRIQEIDDRLKVYYFQLDGTMDFPNNREGDLLKLVFLAIKNLQDNQLITTLSQKGISK